MSTADVLFTTPTIKYEVHFYDADGATANVYDTFKEAIEFHNTVHEDDRAEAYPRPVVEFFIVGLALNDLAYGGPEEGGWYYTTTELQRDHGPEFTPVVCMTSEEANVHLKRINALVEAQNLNEGRPEISSVASRGRYHGAILPQRTPVVLYSPSVRPRYC